MKRVVSSGHLIEGRNEGRVMSEEEVLAVEVVAPEPAMPVQVSSKRESVFSNMESFEVAQRMGKVLSMSTIVPADYRGRENIPNCMIALNMAQRLEIDPLMIMQNMYIVHGKPSWSSQFMIACVNESGLFTALRYDITGTVDTNDWGCVAWAIEKSTGERLESARVTIGMAKSEKWYDKNGSKWKTMPELMMRYRSATFFARTYCPQLTMGFSTQEEVIDTVATVIDATPAVPPSASNVGKKAADAVKKAGKAVPKKPSAPKVDKDTQERTEWLEGAEKTFPAELQASLDNYGTTLELAAVEPDLFAEVKAHFNAAVK